MDILNDILWRSMLQAIWLGNLFAAVYALLLVFLPDRAQGLAAMVDRRLSLAALLSAANRSWRIERYVYRHHRMTGLIIFACSAYVLDAFLLRRTRDLIAPLVRPSLQHLLDAGIAFFVIVAVIGALLGAIVFFKPSLLKDLETAANAQVSLRPRPSFVLSSHLWLDEYVAKRRKLVGACLFFCCSAVLFLVGNVLLGSAWRL